MCGMATRLQHKPVRRPSLPLTAQDEQDLALVREVGFHNDTMSERSGERVGADATESSLLHAIFRIGLKTFLDEIAAQGYAELAADKEYMDEMRRIARRRRPSWADEE